MIFCHRARLGRRGPGRPGPSVCASTSWPTATAIASCLAGWPAFRHRIRPQFHLHAARRRQQGHLGGLAKSPVEEVTLLQRFRPGRRAAPHGQQPAQPAGGQFLLARPLFANGPTRRARLLAQRPAAVQPRANGGAMPLIAATPARAGSRANCRLCSGSPGRSQSRARSKPSCSAAIFDTGPPRQPSLHDRTTCCSWPSLCATAPPMTCGGSSASSTTASPPPAAGPD